MYFAKTPYIVNLIYPSLIWEIKDKSKNIYLTFDDGPDEDITPEVLNILDQFEAKASFFCVGEKVNQNPDIYNEIIKRGHTVGNHSYNHLKGKQTSIDDYLNNVLKASSVIHSNLFRPPYGSFNNSQVRKLKKDYKIIMWSVLPGDFDKSISKETVLRRAIKHTKSGSIVVLHDNKKFKNTMVYALKGFLNHFKLNGYNFKAISQDLF